MENWIACQATCRCCALCCASIGHVRMQCHADSTECELDTKRGRRHEKKERARDESSKPGGGRGAGDIDESTGPEIESPALPHCACMPTRLEERATAGECSTYHIYPRSARTQSTITQHNTIQSTTER